MFCKISRTLARLGLVLLAASVVVAGGFDLSWYTIDAGGSAEGGFSTGGGFELGGTIGQPDAGVMTGGDFELSGGFWFTAVATPPSCACGDMDGDGEVTLGDFVTFARCFGLTSPTEQCSAEELFCSDLTGDGEVNLADFVTFAQLFGQSAVGSPPNCGP